MQKKAEYTTRTHNYYNAEHVSSLYAGKKINDDNIPMQWQHTIHVHCNDMSTASQKTG